MSRVRTEVQQLSGLWCHSLKEPDLCELLRQYHALLLSLHGPKGGTLLLQHSGGLDSFINSSSDLTKKVHPFHPCLKFINAVMEAQVSAYGSHGLYCGLLSTALLRELLLLTQDVPQAVVRDVADGLASSVITHCSEPTSLLDLSNLHQMLSFVSSCLDSKALGLNATEKAHLRTTVLEAFLMSVSDAGDARAFGDVAVTVALGRPLAEAAAFKGLLYRHHRFHELSMSRIIDKLETFHVSCTTNAVDARGRCGFSPSERLVGSFSQKHPSKRILQSKMLNRYSHNSFTELYDETIRVLLFNIMLEFTNSKTERVQFAGSIPSSSVFDVEVSKKLCCFIKQEGIHIVACQKVVSESITFELERLGVLVLERLGTSLTASLEKLAGCRPLSDLSLLDVDLQPCSGTGHARCGCPLSHTIGTVDSVQRLHLPGGLYLLVQKTAPQLPVVTLLLPSWCSQVGENLKVVVQEALKSVAQTALAPEVVCTRCWGASLAALLQRQDIRLRLLQETSATEAQVALVTDAFRRVLVSQSAYFKDKKCPQPTPLPSCPVWGPQDPHQQERKGPQDPTQQRGAVPVSCNTAASSSTVATHPTCTSAAEVTSAASDLYCVSAPNFDTSASCTSATCTSTTPASCTSATSATCTSVGCLLESHAAAYSAISSALETTLQLFQVDYCIFD